MKKTLLLTAASACVLATSSVQANLLINSGFEASGAGLIQNTPGTGIGWYNILYPTFSNATVDTIGDSHSGSNAAALTPLSLGPISIAGSLYQDVVLAPNVTATIDFWAKTSGPGDLNVSLNDVKVPLLSIASSTGYTEYTYTVTPTSATGSLFFSWDSNSAGSGTMFLDDVTLSQTPVPEPSTVIAGALLLLPFGLSTLRRVRNRLAA